VDEGVQKAESEETENDSHMQQHDILFQDMEQI
jgi:hypothetical protein